ncbi:MAG: hypothetical protein ISS77_03535 [Phycisphaerae bacterium]|nr:hypothetical protein [Phycisphaerae bacterium]
MKDMLKNPVLYYVLAPIIILIWPLALVFVYEPASVKQKQDLADQYQDAQVVMNQILEIDGSRLDYKNNRKGKPDFDYAVAINDVSQECSIKSSQYELSAKPVRESRGQKTQDCRVVLEDVGIEGFAKFLSALQIRWAGLQCSNLTLTKQKDSADSWKVDLDFTYYY